MKRIIWSLFAIALVAVPLSAESRHESYFTYEDGGTVLVQSNDTREVEVRVNLPVFPGDEVRSGRRGRSEVLLADGNSVGIDRDTAVRFQSIANSYESDGEQSVVELLTGQIMVNRRAEGTVLRIDSRLATYLASDDSIFGIDTSSGKEILSVYAGSVEARTPEGASRVRAGEQVDIGRDGIYASSSVVRSGTTEFERWFLKRVDRYGNRSSRYLDNSVGYAEDDLDEYGSWVYISSYGRHVWRPYVSVGWRPYYNGYWHSGPTGSLVWVSNEPWGWVPYHYGRWTMAPGFGWVWMPGWGYSPAWVYWMYGPSYIGWSPAGWYDCYNPYYSWAYRPYYDRQHFHAGFYGRVTVNDVDLNGWTFMNSGHVVSRRVDQAALTTDAIRGRLGRDGKYATVSNSPARFSRQDLKDPSSAVGVIARRGIGSGTGTGGSAATTDMTPFFRRDAELPNSMRSRITRGDDGKGTAGTTRRQPTLPSGAVATSPDRIGREPVRRGGSDGTTGGVDRGRGSSTPGAVRRDPPASTQQPGTVRRPATRDVETGSSWRNRGTSPEPATPVNRGNTSGNGETAAPAPRRGSEVTTSPAPRGGTDWRSRAVPRAPAADQGQVSPRRERSAPSAGSDDRGTVRRDAEAPRPSSWRDRGSDSSRGSTSTRRDSDVPRRVIDQIGGARVRPSGGSSSETRTRSTPSSSPRSVDRPSRSDSPGRSSGSVSPSGGSRSSGSSGSGGRSSDSGSSRSSGSSSSSSGQSSRSSSDGRVDRH